MTTLLLARHGQTDWNVEHRWQGNPPLNESGREQARLLGRAVAAAPPEALFSSDLIRARQTAAIVAEHVRLEVEVDSRLREVDAGEWVGLTSRELEERYPEGFARYHAGGIGWEHGETYEEAVDRVTTALKAIAAVHPGSRVLVVTHAGALCSSWLACGGRLADWEGTYNGDVHLVEIEGERMRWGGLLHREGEQLRGTPTTFWRV